MAGVFANVSALPSYDSKTMALALAIRCAAEKRFLVVGLCAAHLPILVGERVSGIALSLCSAPSLRSAPLVAGSEEESTREPTFNKTKCFSNAVLEAYKLSNVVEDSRGLYAVRT
jgi:hypothetical protein